MKRKFASQAEYYRHHRQVMVLALELGVTPAEADAELARREAHARWRETRARLLARQAQSRPRRNFEEFDAPHMMRN